MEPPRTRLQDHEKQLVHIGSICGRDMYIELVGDPDLKEREFARISEMLRAAFGMNPEIL